jgi:hypothetical protein
MFIFVDMRVVTCALEKKLKKENRGSVCPDN